MKKLFTLLAALLLTSNIFLPQEASAQTPEKMSYQAVIRNSSDALVTNAQVGMLISILQGSATGTVVYSETQTPTTNSNGLLSIEIGGGAGFSAINWANDIYFIKTESDPTGGINYTITGTSQLLSVPYALHAKTAEIITEIDPIFTGSQAANITAIDITNLGNLSGSNTGDQDLILSDNVLTITNNSSAANIDLSVYLDDTKLSETEVDNFVANNNYLTGEVDGSVTNEIQVLSISNDTIYLSQGGYIKLPSQETLKITTEITNVICNGDSDGEIKLTIEGGTEPYIIEWNGIEGASTYSNISAGKYEIYIEDQEGLTILKRVSVSELTEISAETFVTNQEFGNDGEIDLTVSGGTPFDGIVYLYEWNDGPTTQDRTGLAAGTYTVTITDKIGCTQVKETEVISTMNEPLTDDIIITEIMYDPDVVSDALGEWVEIYNTSTEDITALGFQLIDAGGNTATFDLYIPAGAHQVISKSDNTINPGVNGDYIVSILPSLGNAGDAIILKYNGVTIDEVTYTDISIAGRSLSLAPGAYDGSSNDEMSNWYESTNEYFTGAFGTPGVVNPAP